MRFALFAACLASPAAADISVQFIEGAPKDRFVIEAVGGACLDGPAAVTIDLAGSAGALIFDTSGAGAGVEVFQPFELVAGQDRVLEVSEVTDGDQVMTLSLDQLSQGAAIAFTIDLDDTIGAREITVSGSEIAGAQVSVEAGGAVVSGLFDASARALVPWTACVS